jgi:alpha-L-fucosidase
MENQILSNNKIIKFEPTWESLKDYTPPQWYLDAKFGIFIHWGVYSVPAFGNEWYPRNMYLQDSKEFKHHLETYGPHSRFGYKDFIPLLTAEKFDPNQWVKLFKDAGAKYVVPVAEHHDGFAMYDCSSSDWKATKMGPKRDIIGELAEAVRKENLIFGVSSHRAEHWWFFNGGMNFESDVQDPAYRDLYGPAKIHVKDWKSLDSRPRPDAKFLDDWFARNCELVDKYQPQLLWFDWWIEQAVFEPYLQKFAAFYYNRSQVWQRGVAINFKNETFPEGTAVYDIERGHLSQLPKYFWQTDTSISKTSWGYIKNPQYKTAGEIIRALVDIVSKNGSLLLNVGPRPDGTIPEEEEAILREIGAWLAVNGEAIYGTRPWQVFGEGPTPVSSGKFKDNKPAAYTFQDIRFTRKGNSLYAFCLDLPRNEIIIKSFKSRLNLAKIVEIHMLGSLGGPLIWYPNENELKIIVPDEKPCEHVCTFKILLEGSE